jgi:hypothetical protein
MPIAHTRRLIGAGATLLVLALLVASPAHAAIDCDLQPTAPICNRGDDPGGDPGGGGSAPADPLVFTASQTDQVGSGEFVSTSTIVDRGAEMMYTTVHTWTTNWFWGFHGCVEFDLLSAGGAVATHSQTVCYGVDGTAIGRSDRTDKISWHLRPYTASVVRSVRIIHSKL